MLLHACAPCRRFGQRPGPGARPPLQPRIWPRRPSHRHNAALRTGYATQRARHERRALGSLLPRRRDRDLPHGAGHHLHARAARSVARVLRRARRRGSRARRRHRQWRDHVAREGGRDGRRPAPRDPRRRPRRDRPAAPRAERRHRCSPASRSTPAYPANASASPTGVSTRSAGSTPSSTRTRRVRWPRSAACSVPAAAHCSCCTTSSRC